MQNLTRLDQFISDIDRGLRTLLAPKSLQQRATPAPQRAPAIDLPPLTRAEERLAGNLMRINHAGEVAAQALYFGHARFARTKRQAAQMLQAAAEEGDHLAWCAERLSALNTGPSAFGPIWYAGAYAMGAASALIGDQFALSFVAETERQVEAHLQTHTLRLPPADSESLAVLLQMRADEAEHGQAALAAGGGNLPWPLPSLMGKAADVMRRVAFYG